MARQLVNVSRGNAVKAVKAVKAADAMDKALDRSAPDPKPAKVVKKPPRAA
jgi:hypothetical protein